MSLADRPLNVAILAVPEVTASALFGMLDLRVGRPRLVIPAIRRRG
jgi:hypothetical protein